MKSFHAVSRKGCKYIVISIAFVLFMTSTSFGFSDLKETDSAYEDVKLLTDAGFLKGYTDGTFRPKGSITRAEFARLTNQIFGYDEQIAGNIFSDVGEKEWYYKDVMHALQAGYIIGYPDGTFRPNENIKREEACVIIDNILKLSDRNLSDTGTIVIADRVSPWAKESVGRVIALGLMGLENGRLFRATEKATRAEVSSAYATLYRLWDIINDPEQGGEGNLNIAPKIRESIKNVLSITKNEILTSNNLTNKQKETANIVYDTLDEYYKTGDKVKLFQNKDKIKNSYYSLSSIEQSTLEKEIRRCIPATDLYNIRDYLF